MSKPDGISREATLRVRDACLCLHTQRAGRALARRFDRAFAHLGMTNGQFSLMMSLNRPEPPALGEIARLLAMDRTSLTAMLKPLERRGWVKVRVDPRDRRSRRPALTDQGRAALARGLAIWEAEHAALEAELANPQALRDGLNALAFGPAPDPSPQTNKAPDPARSNPDSRDEKQAPTASRASLDPTASGLSTQNNSEQRRNHSGRES